MREWFPRSISRQRRSLFGFVSVITLVALLGLESGALARLQAALDSPSPATGHASIIAQGVSELPFDPITWRVVRDTAEPLDVALPVERALGFVVAEPDGVHVVDVSAGTQERLAPGEASFVPESASQTRASLTDAETSYLRVALVGEADVNDPGDDELVFAGAPFAAPGGLRDIDLLRDVLAQDEKSQIVGGDYPVLVVVTAGAVEIDAGGQPVELQTGEAAEFSGDISVRGLQEESSFIAGVIGPEVPVPPRTSGTITVATYLCEPGVEPADLGDPINDEAAANCAPAPEEILPSLTTPDGGELTADDAEALRDGVYGWIGVPFGDYVVNPPADLPENTGDPTFYDVEGNALAGGEVTIDRDVPDVHINLYLFQTGGGSVALTVHNCPSGWTPESGDPAECEVATEGFELTLTPGNEEGETLTLADAELVENSFVWSGLGLSDDADTLGDGFYVIDEPSLPDGYDAYVTSAEDTTSDGFSYVNLTADAPAAEIAIYNYSTGEQTGTITLDTLECPSMDSGPEECERTFGPTGLTGIYIADVNGEFGVLTEENASQEGDGPFVWPRIPLAAYLMDTSGLTAPEGYEIISVILTPDGTDISAGFELTEGNAIANILVLLTPVDGGEPAADADGDGLADAGEVTAGTDPANPDSDGDCHADGPEVDAGTDPLDPGSLPEGDCDLIEATNEN